MHVFLVIVGGTLLLGVFALFGWLWGANLAGVALATQVFIGVWALVALANLWVGVNHAGYGLREELPILLVVFAVPAVLAALAIGWIGRG